MVEIRRNAGYEKPVLSNTSQTLHNQLGPFRYAFTVRLCFLETQCLNGEQNPAAKTNGTTAANCGAIALAQLARALGVSSEAQSAILNAPAPSDGFSIAELQQLGARSGVKLEAVRRPKGAEIATPCLVHWNIGHYGVILERNGSKYRVTDERTEKGVWVDARAMEIYSSGIFLTPRELLTGNWQRLSKTEAEGIRGTMACYGYLILGGDCYSSLFPDDEDPPQDCCDDNDDQDADCDPPSANDGASDGGGEPPPPPCCCDMGMPKWSVSAFVNLWLVDRPLLYKTTNDKWFPLKLTYNSRGVDHGTNSFGFGPKWECNWMATMQENATNGLLKNFRAGGGFETNMALGQAIYRSAQIREATIGGGHLMRSPRGGVNQYGYFFQPMPTLTNYYMDKRMDRYGRTVYYNYETVGGVARLASVIDTDGHTNTLTYNGNFVSTVRNPYGDTAHFYYNADGMLTNITDAAGMSSYFYYSNKFLTNMVTPYGTTSFEHMSDTNGDRALLVTEANGENQLYAFVPGHTPAMYHWNRSQYNAISEEGKANYLEMPSEDYDKAEAQWLLYRARRDGDPLIVSDTAAASAPPLDPLQGIRPNYFSFTYQGQTNTAYTGTLKRVTSITRGSSLQVGIARNNLGRPLFITNYNFDGSIAVYTNVFDTGGRYLQKQFGPHGELVRGYGYHSVITNLLVSVTNAVGEVTRYTHDTNTMKVTSIAFAGGLVRTNEYSNGFLAKQTDEGIRTNSFTYSNGNVASQTNELGLATTRSYDELNRLRQINFPDGTTISNFYDKLDLAGVKDRLGNWTRYTYNLVRQLIGETNANGAVTTYAYCSCGSPSSITRWNGATPLTDTFSFDLLGRLTNATYADGYQLNYLYDGRGLLLLVTDSSGLTLSVDYLQFGQQFKMYNAYLGGQQILVNGFDDYGRLVGTLDRNSITVSNSYDLVNRLVTRVTFDWYLTPYATNMYNYSARGLTNIVDALNHATWFARDVAGRLQYQTNANNEVMQFTYNPADELLSLIDGKNQTTHWNYNEYGLVTNKVDQANAEILRYTYDPVGRLTNRWSAAKGDTKFKYDALGNLTNIDYPSSADISFAYDALNRLTNIIDGSGTTRFTYSDSGQLVSEDGPFASDMVTSSYWNRMRTNLTLLQPTGTWTNEFIYDSFNRLYSVASRAGIFTYNYAEPSTRLTGIALPSGAYTHNEFDSMSRLSSTFLYNASGTPMDGYLYQYDRENQRTNEVRADSSTLDYKYDNIGQLVVADSSVPTEDRGYTYDAAWNLNYRTNNGSLSTFIVDNKNELTNAFTFPQSFDGNGNLSGVGSGRVYVYDDENQLIQWFSYQLGSSSPTNGDLRTDFAYDGLGRLRKRIEYVLSCPVQATNPPPDTGPQQQEDPGGGNNCTWTLTNEVHYVYDGMRVIQERDGSNVPTCAYTRGNDLSVSLEGAGGIGGLLARSRYFAGSPTSPYLYFSDGNGNITYMLATNQTMAASYRYDPFGNIISKSGSQADVNVYRFSSKEVHVNSGMYYYGFRFYDPNLQRWINRDPLSDIAGLPAVTANLSNLSIESRAEDGMSGEELFHAWTDIHRNHFVALNNAPINRLDPSGQCALVIPIIIAIAEGMSAEAGVAVAGGAVAASGGVLFGSVLTSHATASSPAIGTYYPNFASPNAVPATVIATLPVIMTKIWPGDSGAREWGRRNGVNPKEAQRGFHRIKQGDNMSKPGDNYGVNPETGDVHDPKGDIIGNLGDECL